MIEIPDIKGKELTEFLIANKAALIAQKKEFVKRCDVVMSNTHLIRKEGSMIPSDSGSINVKVVANTSLWCDSQMDVLLRDSASKSIRERKGMIPHIHDHIHEISAKVGEVNDIYYQDIPLTDLGVNQQGVAQCLVFDTDIMKSYNEQVFNQYKAGKINQHSIGLQYVKLDLAINDSDSEKEFDYWNKYIGQVINRKTAEDKGFFWVVSEYKLIENSAVLFGSNSLTPTLSPKQEFNVNNAIAKAFGNTSHEPPTSTQAQPFIIADAISKINLFN